MHGAVKVLAMSLVIAMILSYIAIMVGIAPASTVPARVSYTSHATISINGNADFATQAAAESWPGDGSSSNPYIISGYDVDASSANGILIQNTNVHFIVSDCYIHDGSGHSGIFLANCNNGTLFNNDCSNNFDGIYLDSSNNNTISSNNCSSNGDGIYIESSNNNTISSNNCSSNGDGIFLWSSNNNTISSNNCSSNSNEGIMLDSSSNITLIDNICSNNGYDGIMLGSSSNDTVSNNNCSWNNGIGMYIGSLSNSTISNNNCSNNGYDGIYLESSNNNIIIWNQLFNNIQCGVNISSSCSSNMIWNNTFIKNNGTDSTYDSANVQAYDDGTNNWWNSSDYGNYWSDWTTPDLDANGIVDVPYDILGGAGAKDYYPLTFLPENIAPITTAASTGTIGSSGWYRSNASVSLSATDAGSGVNATFYRIGTSGSWSGYSSSFVISNDGNHTVEFYSMDNAGNIESVKSISVKIDKTSPTLIINQTAGFEATVNYAIISWIGTDAMTGIDHFEVSIDGGAFASVGMAMSHNFSTLADGTHDVTVKAVDVAGNEVNKTIQFTVSATGSGDALLLVIVIVIIIVAVIITIFILMKKGYIAKIVTMMKKKP